MKLTRFIHFSVVIIAIVSAAKRPYTTPSPFGSYRIKLFKCSCTDLIYKYLHRNFSCFAKAVSRDISTINAYAKLKHDINKIWVNGYIEYKYGTIYRTVMRFKKIEGCETVKFIKDHKGPMMQVIYKYVMMNTPEMIHPCPYIIGEEFSAYNLTIDPKYLPSIFNQGDYRGVVQVYMEKPDQLVCNDTFVVSIVSPIKESFGRK